MTANRTTPLNSHTIKKHQCTLDVQLEKLGMVPFFQGLDSEAELCPGSDPSPDLTFRRKTNCAYPDQIV